MLSIFLAKQALHTDVSFSRIAFEDKTEDRLRDWFPKGGVRSGKSSIEDL
jgi:hypothetical protein